MVQRMHLVEIDGVTSSVKLADVYNATGSDIGGVIGISRINNDTNVPANTRPLDLNSAIANGLMVRLNLRYSSTGGTGRTKYGKIVCPIDKAYTAVTQLEGRQYRGGTVTNVSVPQRARFT